MASLIDPPAEARAPRAASGASNAGPSAASAAGAVSGMVGSPPELVAVLARLRHWFREEGYWYATSAVVHAIGFVIFALVVTFLPDLLPAGAGQSQTGEAPVFQSAEQGDTQTPDLTKFQLGNPQLKESDISTDALREMQAQGGRPIYIDKSPEFEEPGGGTPTNLAGPELGGLGRFTVHGVPGIGGLGGVGVSHGTGTLPGSGGSGVGFGPRGKGSRAGGPGGATRQSDHAVLGGLVWLAKHQGPNGAWSLQHSRFCPIKQGCGGDGIYRSDVAATALALLPFLGAGQTHQTPSNGPFRKQIAKGLTWLISQQAPDGSLSRRGTGRGNDFGEEKPMYTHALATIVLCEAYGLTNDPKVGAAADKAVRFIEAAQNESTGGWRYKPKDPGDTSVLGWQVMALKSAQMAGIGVNSVTLESPRKWLSSVAVGHHHGLFCYVPYDHESPAMTAVGQLCLQYMGSAPDDAALLEGKEYLMINLPDASLRRDIYYWYYATLVLHNYLDKDWDTWNRTMRRALVNTQVPEGCGTGSWAPDLPTLDKWGSHGGRLYVTSLSVLTLEVYYRYLPLFRVSGPPPTLPSPDPKAPPAKAAQP